jgi:hypothetical protein
MNLKSVLTVKEISIIKEPCAFLQVTLLLVRIRIAIIRIRNLTETWWEWNEQSPGLAKAPRAENPVVILDQTDAAHHKCAHNITRDGGSEKQTRHASTMFRLDGNGVQLVNATQERLRPSRVRLQ